MDEFYRLKDSRKTKEQIKQQEDLAKKMLEDTPEWPLLKDRLIIAQDRYRELKMDYDRAKSIFEDAQQQISDLKNRIVDEILANHQDDKPGQE